MTELAVQVEGVSVSYDGGAAVLHEVSLDVRNGERLCLLGPSGSGKTTLLQLVAGFVSPSEGCVLISGVDQVSAPPHRRNIGIVFQNLALFPHMSVYENVAFGLKTRGTKSATIHAKVAKAVELVGLKGLEKRKPRQLSGGQQQRVAFARAIVFEPAVLLLDEPFSSLDTNLRKSIRNELARLQDVLGIPTILVTHDQQEALSFGHRIVILNEGHVEQVGSPIDVYTKPATKFAASFIGDANYLPGEVKRVDGSSADVQVGAHLLEGLRVADPATGLPVNGHVDVLVRPEWLTMSAGGCVDMHYPLEAEVASHTFLGETSEYVLRVADREVIVRQPSSGSLVDAGTRVAVGWGQRVLTAFPAVARG